MTSLTLQQIMASRFRTSAHADGQTKMMMEALGLSTKANVARLAIGRSLSLGELHEVGVDAKGLEIPASSLFSQDDVAVWVGLLVEHAKRFSGLSQVGMDDLRNLVRQHWHRGAGLLASDWSDANEDYDTFVSALVKRRAELSDEAGSQQLLDAPANLTPEMLEDISAQLGKALLDIGVFGTPKGVVHGPRLSRYRVLLRDVNQLDKLKKGLERLALALNQQGRTLTLGHSDEAKTITIDIPRSRNEWFSYGYSEMIEALRASNLDAENLIVCPGVDVVGNPVKFDLATAPHLLVGGATGKGKSVCVHALIASLLFKHTPATLKLAMIDPKQVEFAVYGGSKYLWGDSVAVGVEGASAMLDSLIEEMDSRYAVLRSLGASNIGEARTMGTRLPFIVACIDEMADLIIQDRGAENKIVRLAQLARAAGIHLILATQRPDAKTFSGLIRSNVPARIALTVQKSSESQIILDETGAEDLLGAGDMIIKTSGSDSIRAHGYFLSLDDVRLSLK